MMIKYFLIFATLFWFNSFSQKKEPVIFAEGFLGATRFADHRGWISGGELNYQEKNNLFTFRYVENYYEFVKLQDVNMYMLILWFPVTGEAMKLKDYSVLYGYRKAEDNFSYSFSGGISYNQFLRKFSGENNQEYALTDKNVGFPFEANIKWFKREKAPYRIYGILPVGKPTSLGKSFGVKLLGNISKHSYVGIALVFGLGIHKEY